MCARVVRVNCYVDWCKMCVSNRICELGGERLLRSPAGGF